MSPEQIQAGALIALGVVALLIVVWLLMRANRKTTIVGDDSSGKDVLDEGSAKAARNQALIDAPTSMEQSFGKTTAAANTQKVAAAGGTADAEAGMTVAPSVVNAPPPPEPAPAPAKPPSAPAPASGDDLRKIKGLGPKLVALLADQGITSFAQIAAWTDADVERIDATLGRFAGRITRDQWIEQAKLLVEGKEDTFSEKFGQK